MKLFHISDVLSVTTGIVNLDQCTPLDLVLEVAAWIAAGSMS